MILRTAQESARTQGAEMRTEGGWADTQCATFPLKAFATSWLEVEDSNSTEAHSQGQRTLHSFGQFHGVRETENGV